MAKETILILETMAETKYFVEVVRHTIPELQDCSVLSFQPNIQVYLADHNIQSISSAEVTNAATHAAVMDKCFALEDQIKNFLSKHQIAEPEKYFKQAYFHFLRLIWRHFLWNIAVLDGCLSKGKYRQVYAFKFGKRQLPSYWITHEQIYLGELAERMCANRGMKFVGLKGPNFPKKVVPASICQIKPPSFFDHISSFLFRQAFHLFVKRPVIFFPSFKYNMHRLCSKLQEKNKKLGLASFYLGKAAVIDAGLALALLVSVILRRKIKHPALIAPLDFIFPIIVFARTNFKSYDNSLPKQYMHQTLLALDDKAAGMAVFKGVDFLDLYRPKVAADLIPYMLQIHFQAFGLQKAIEAMPPDLIISQLNFEIYGALGTIAKQFNINSILISHGSHVLQSDKYAAREHQVLTQNILLGDYQYFAVQSPHAQRIAKQILEEKGRIIPVFPVLWGKEIKRDIVKNSDHLTIVHAGTPKLRHNRRFIYETSDEFVLGLKDLCDIVAGLPKLKLIIKFRPDPYEISMATLEKLLPKADNISIECQKPFLEVLRKADLVISFSSTTIEEALVNQVPVLLYGGHGRYAHIPVQPYIGGKNINAAVTFAKNRNDLLSFLREFNQAGKSYAVGTEQFAKHRFVGDEAVDVCDWLLKNINQINS